MASFRKGERSPWQPWLPSCILSALFKTNNLSRVDQASHLSPCNEFSAFMLKQGHFHIDRGGAPHVPIVLSPHSSLFHIHDKVSHLWGGMISSIFSSCFSYLINIKELIPPSLKQKSYENAHELALGKEPLIRQQELKKLVMSGMGCRSH